MDGAPSLEPDHAAGPPDEANQVLKQQDHPEKGKKHQKPVEA
jgi:hypothetical protein